MPILHYVSKEEQNIDGKTACESYLWQWGTTNWNNVNCPYCLKLCPKIDEEHPVSLTLKQTSPTEDDRQQIEIPANTKFIVAKIESH